MAEVSHSERGADGASENRVKLMASGFVFPKGNRSRPFQVSRGMPILSKEGRELGKVAAVVMNSTEMRSTHILLSRLPEENGYWMVPVEWIEEVGGNSIRLSTGHESTGSFPEWHSP